MLLAQRLLTMGGGVEIPYVEWSDLATSPADVDVSSLGIETGDVVIHASASLDSNVPPTAGGFFNEGGIQEVGFSYRQSSRVAAGAETSYSVTNGDDSFDEGVFLVFKKSVFGIGARNASSDVINGGTANGPVSISVAGTYLIKTAFFKTGVSNIVQPAGHTKAFSQFNGVNSTMLVSFIGPIDFPSSYSSPAYGYSGSPAQLGSVAATYRP